MPRVIITEGAGLGLERCRKFVAEKSPQIAGRAGQAIARQLAHLEISPNMGRPFAELTELRELIVEFGESGYVALYRFVPKDDVVYVLAFRHQKEAGY